MYIRPEHAELDVSILHAFIKEHPLGLFTVAIPNEQHQTIQTTHIPFVLDTSSSSSPNDDSSPSLGVLRGHMGRANPQTKMMIDSLSSSTTSSGFLSSWFSSAPRPSDPIELRDDVLVLFNAPVHSYVTPKFYTETKPSSGKVVPTWDYAAVQVYGRARIHYENNDVTGDFLQRQLEDLTNQEEVSAGHDKPWEVSDAPKSYVDLRKKGIIGIEIRITQIEGRFKLSQERSDGDWKGVVKGFRGLGTEKGDRMAEMIEQKGEKRGLNVKGGETVEAAQPVK
jgi:transcriptional regulator